MAAVAADNDQIALLFFGEAMDFLARLTISQVAMCRWICRCCNNSSSTKPANA